jgi:hypothetical protein
VARPRVHLAVSLALAAAQYGRTRRLLPALAPLVGGFLVDADHLVDHWLYRALPRGAKERIILPLHGWEYLPPLFALEPRLSPATDRGLFAGYLAHLLVDQLSNDVAGPLTYSLVYRALTGFRGGYFRQDDAPPAEGAHSWRDTPLWQIWRWL